MKRGIITGLMIILFATNAFALDLNYTLTTEFADKTVAMLKDFENNIWFEVAKANPSWTDYQIAKEVIKRIIVRNVRRFEAQVAAQQAVGAVVEDTEGMQ